ncbi:Shikimate O-hydroxycinnamoyltransferase, partial [Bienertia sinuspersici]
MQRKGAFFIEAETAHLTRFKCGGVTLGFEYHHHVSDGASRAHLINSWARMARGIDLAVVPFHDRATCFASRNPPQVNFQHVEYHPPLPPSPPTSLS